MTAAQRKVEETEIKGITPKLLWRGLAATAAIIVSIISSTAFIVNHMDSMQAAIEMNTHRIDGVEKWQNKQEQFNDKIDSRLNQLATITPLDNLRTAK